MSHRLNVVVGITGGIAAYKAVGVVREFVLAGHDVHVVASEHALRFVGRPTLEAISRNPVHSDLFEGVAQVRHVAIGQAADLVVVAPATADTIAKMAAGLAGDLLGSTLLATTAPVVIAPAMHTEMWQHPATVANIATLRARGVHIVGPASGALTGTDVGPGRMSEPSDIVAAALAAMGPRDLSGLRVVVSAGGTREPIDPVRYIGNRSSGRQGLALAAAARDRGADVVLVAAHLESGGPPAGVRLVPVSTAAELEVAMRTVSATADVVIMAAAVADYRPETVADEKIKKETQGDELTLRLVRNPDILRGIVDARPAGQTIVGFAAETEPDDARLLELARAKAARKGVDALVVNRVGWTEVFGQADNRVLVLGDDGEVLATAEGAKSVVADSVMDVILSIRAGGAR